MMEGIILGLETLASPWNIIAGVSLLAVVVGGVLLGYMSEEEKSGRRLYWAEWPISDFEITSPKEELRLAA
jgi:hypothetical protein